MKNKIYKCQSTSCCTHALSYNLKKNILNQNLVLVPNCDVFRQHHEHQLTDKYSCCVFSIFPVAGCTKGLTGGSYCCGPQKIKQIMLNKCFFQIKE